MANLDTKAKRKSSVSILMPFMPPGVVPGVAGQGFRQAGAWSYSGVLVASMVPGVLKITFTGAQPYVTFEGKQPDINLTGKQPYVTFEGA